VILSLGLAILYLIGVKTHFVTVLLSLLIIGMRLNRRLGLDLLVVFAGLVLFTLTTEFGSGKFENYMEQLFVGGHRFENDQVFDEAGRLEVIFNFGEYLALLQLSTFDLFAGSANFFQALNSPFLFEQKILVYMLVLVVPYIPLLCLLMLLGLRDSFFLRVNGSRDE